MSLNDIRFRSQKRRLPKTEIERVVWTNADAIHAFHATRIDNHPVLLHFRVHLHVRSARGSTMPALIARRRDPDFSRREFVGETEETPIRARISAKAFLPQKINGDEAANKQKRDGHRDRRKRRPKICGHQMIREFRDDWSVSRIRKQSISNGPDKHVQRRAERDIHQEPRPKRLRMKTHFLEQPAAEILQCKYVTTPPTNKTSEDERRQNCQAKKDEARVHKPVLQRVHRFRGLDRRNRLAHEPPLNDVRDHEQIQSHQRGRAPPTGLRFTYTGLTEARDVDPGTGSPRNRSSCFQFSADATTFHRVGEFTLKQNMRHQQSQKKRSLPG